jgi:hypothetical protein
MKSTSFLLTLGLAVAFALFLACDDDDDSPAPEQTRTYRMGFSGIPPRDSLEARRSTSGPCARMRRS